MFNIGDKVVYPMHGAGIIESIEEKEILETSKSTYIMRMPIGNMKVMIPLESVDDIGLREVINKEQVDMVVVLSQHKPACPIIGTEGTVLTWIRLEAAIYWRSPMWFETSC